MPTCVRPNILENQIAGLFIVPGTPVITGRPGTTGVTGSEGTPSRLGTPVTWDATSASPSATEAAAGARVGDGVGSTRVAGVEVGEVCWW